MLHMFHVEVLKVDRVLHMLQWHRWLADGGLAQGFASYLAPSSHGAPLPLPSLPFPASMVTIRAQPTSVWSRGRRVGAGTGSANESAKSRTSDRRSNKRGTGGRANAAGAIVCVRGGVGVGMRMGLASKCLGASHYVLLYNTGGLILSYPKLCCKDTGYLRFRFIAKANNACSGAGSAIFNVFS